MLREVCGENVIMGEGLAAIGFGKLMALNATAAWLWKQAKEMGEFTIETLAERLSVEYEVTAVQAHEDVTRLVGEWQKAGVVE